MILDNNLKVKNYKCFGEEPQGFEKIYPINIIVGKNNSGKSSLIDLVEFATKPNNTFLKTGRSKKEAEVSGSFFPIEANIGSYFPTNRSGGGIPGTNFYKYGLTLVNQKVEFTIGNTGSISVTKWEKNKPINQAVNDANAMVASMHHPLQKRNFIRINAERDIQPEASDNAKLVVNQNGTGATNVIRLIFYKSSHDTNLIRVKLLEELNKVVNPDIFFTEILPQEHDNAVFEFFLANSHNEQIPLSKMGSGIKTILIVLLQLIVLPEVNLISKQDLVFGFEELENNLHPSLQRRLFNYIADYVKQFESYFFITTHSSVVIDLFGSNSSDSQILHVINKGESSIVKSILNHSDGKSVLKDLDYKASDLLLSNGVIWVEGPSDALYLELFIDLYRKEIAKEELGRLNFTIQSLATAIWKFAGFTDFKWDDVDSSTENKIISLAKVNHNHLIIIDKDDNYEDKKPSDYKSFLNGNGVNKARLIHESLKFSDQDENDLSNNWGETKDGKLFFLITDGTFEAYLEYFILNKGATDFSKYFDKSKQRGYFKKMREGSNSSISKVQLASDICKKIRESNCTLDDIAPAPSDLFTKIMRLYSTIETWR